MGKMESSLVFLCLWICFIVYASTSNGCTEIPVVENAEVAETSKKPHYSEGDTLDYICGLGYASLIKIIYKCNNNKWTKWRGEKCSLKRCESPEDIPNGRYIIERGSGFVFGTVIKYICNDGFQIMSRFDTRTCRDGGWDNQLPACEEVSCERKTAEGNIRVEGLPNDPEDFIRYGQRLTFSCLGEGLILRGPKEITCLSNGEWSSPFPKCVEVTCEGEQLINVDILTGHPGIISPYKPGHVLVFRCTDVDLKMQGQRVIECLSNGKWDQPYPKCEAAEVTCEGEQLIGVDILTGHPGIAPPYKRGHVLVFRCTDVTLKMQGQRVIECLPNGKWDQPYPKCEEIKCEAPRDQHVYSPSQYFRGDMKLGARRSYRCESGYEKMAEEATCTRDGWTPKPLCAKSGCEAPRDQHVYRSYEYFRGDMKLGSKQYYSCESGYEKMAEDATCTRDGWTPNPLCAKSGCEAPRDQHVYSPSQYFRGDMKLGARRSYRCESGYDKMAEEATCTRDGWTPKPLCAKSGCEAPRDQHIYRSYDYFRGDMKLGSKQYYSCESGYEKMAEGATCTRDGWTPNPLCAKSGCEAPRDQHVYSPSQYFRGDMKLGARRSYRCESGYDKMAEEATCTRDGWTPKPLCAKSGCEAPRDQHIYRSYDYFRGDMKLGSKQYYSCESGYEKMAEEATCTRDGWTPNPLCAVMTVSAKCGPPPRVNDADTVEMTKKEYNTGERVEYICFNKYILDQRHSFTKYLTCQQGQWRGNVKCLKPCTVTKELMAERGIDLAYVNKQKMFAPHNDHITFACLWGKVSVGITDFRQKCNDGEMTLPECLKMKYYEIFLFLLLMIMAVSTNAQEVTCEGEQLIGVDILTGHPGIVSPYKPGHVLVFRCTDVDLKMQGQRTIECLSNGKWDQPYPKCEEVTCEGEQLINVDILTGHPEIKCEAPRDQHVYSPSQYFRGDMKLGARRSYRCESGYEKMAAEATCTRDGWTPKPLCAVMTVSAKCGPPPRVNNADTAEMIKREYNTGERVEYVCFNKYILDQRHSFTKYLTCQQGQWRGNIKCLKPCTVTKELMAERGIDLAYVNKQKMFAPHNDHITFACLWGKVSVGITDFRQKCNDGEMTLPECV
ncbi:complement factor H-like [Onychostoma macrolepis]|uniref:complement factor H-like n=1 Tax=Onychostoma macrolepis TaxID=369639 RepID=UPI00272CFE04|nr:complement factor H-like [Onychostoma macrolepis]